MGFFFFFFCLCLHSANRLQLINAKYRNKMQSTADRRWNAIRKSSMKQKQWNTNLAAPLLAVVKDENLFSFLFCFKWFGSMPMHRMKINRTFAFIKVVFVNAIVGDVKYFGCETRRKNSIFFFDIRHSLTLCIAHYTWTVALPEWTSDTLQIYIIIKLCSRMLWSWLSAHKINYFWDAFTGVHESKMTLLFVCVFKICCGTYFSGCPFGFRIICF